MTLRKTRGTGQWRTGGRAAGTGKGQNEPMAAGIERRG